MSFGKKIFPLFLFLTATGFENTKVLPQGVRRVNIKALQLNLTEKFDNRGESVGLAQPLEKDITFENVLRSKNGLENTKLRAFMQDNAITSDQVLGSLSADLKGQIRVIAPVVAYGLTERITLAVALPYYLARTEVAVGYRSDDANAQRFINLLSDPKYNLTASARQAYDNFSDGVAALNSKLESNGFQQLSPWEDKGLGDMTLAIKTRISAGDMFSLANLSGIVAPTGKVENPDILTDVSFGDGTWDLFTGLMCDQRLSSELFLNQFVKFTYQKEAQRVMRLKTAEEAIEVAKEEVTYKLGNKLDFGASVQWEGDSGLELGLGYEFRRKFRDRYDASEPVRSELEKNTGQQTNSLELKLGYSSIPAFKRKEIPVPFNISLQHKRVIAGLAKNRNVPATRIFMLDMNLYF